MRLGRGPQPRPQLGSEQLPKPAASQRQESDDALTAVVSEISFTPFGRVVLFLDNGQVWRQLDGDGAKYVAHGNGADLNVTISRGLFGSYDLRFAGQNELFKVRRVK